MADPFTGEIRLFAGGYVPYQWAACDGTTLQIQQNQTLYAVIGTTYGGNGTSTFMLPNLNGRAPLHQGQGPGLTFREIGEADGEAKVTLLQQQIPIHNHVPMALAAAGNSNVPTGATWAENVTGGRTPVPNNQFTATANVALPSNTLAPMGGTQPHNNMQPYLPLQFIICLFGEWPSRP